MSSSNILEELQVFVHNFHLFKHRGCRNVNNILARAALRVLSELPGSRNIIFEYFVFVFDSAVQSYVVAVERDAAYQDENEYVLEIQKALENLVANGPVVWSPLISNWCLTLLGQLAAKHSKSRRQSDIPSTCALWLGSCAMRCLLGIVAFCFEKLDSFQTETCIVKLLNTFVDFYPHFDWVVARLGGCFPMKVISKILHCGLKSYSGNQNYTLESEVSILGYLSSSHQKELKQALLQMVNNGRQGDVLTLPYILHLAKMSDILCQIIVVDIFLELFNEELIVLVRSQYKKWPSDWRLPDCIPILASCILKTTKNGAQVVLLLANQASRFHWCKDLLEFVFLELEIRILQDVAEILFLKNILTHSSKRALWNKCVEGSVLEQQASIRLLLLGCHRTPTIFAQTFSEILMSDAKGLEANGFIPLKRLVLQPFPMHQIEVRHGIFLALELLLLNKHFRNNNIFQNLLSMLQFENDLFNGGSLNKSLFTIATFGAFKNILEIWQILLNNLSSQLTMQFQDEKLEDKPGWFLQECTQADLIAEIVKILVNSPKSQRQMSLSNTLYCTKLAVHYFFICLSLHRIGKSNALLPVQGFFDLITNLCFAKAAARSIALRKLLEGALFTFSFVFGSFQNNEFADQKKASEEFQLLKANQQQEKSYMLNRMLVLHAGVIGNGKLSPLQNKVVGPLPNVKTMFLNAIDACCSTSEQASRIESYNQISILLVEYLTVDVVYNGAVWPEEEYTKVTIERDLHIYRRFQNNPILWSIMSLVGGCRPSLCFCSVILRALCASVLHQWRAKTMENSNHTYSKSSDLMRVTVMLLKLLTLCQMLPPPLDYLYMVIPQLEPFEVSFVLKECVWNFMREFVPSPILFGCDVSGLHWRDPTIAKPPSKFVDPIKNTMQKNMKKFGSLFYHMFCLSETSS